MSRNTLEEFALRWVPGEGPVEIHSLTSGLVNQSCRVARSGRLYSMRVAADSRDLGLDREWECKVLGAAAAAGLAPAIEYCDPAQGILVADWVSGRSWTPEEIRQPDQIHAMAQLLRGIHALPVPQPARIMNPADWIAHYADALAVPRGTAGRPSAGAALSSTGLRGAADARLALLAVSPSQPPEPVLCHSDLHRLNVTIGARLMLLDWEYAHVSHPYWDLAGWVANNDWTDALAGDLLARYLQRPAEPDEVAHLALFVWLYDYVCLLWSELYLKQRPGEASEGVSARAERLANRLSGRLR
jgi:thiamine kinase-like enzyme